MHVGTPIVAKPIPSYILPDHIFYKLNRGIQGYDRTGVALEFATARHMATHQNCLYHILYGENSFNLISRLNGFRNNRVIATFHHPPSKFAEWFQRKDLLKQLSAVIIVGRNQLAMFAEVLPEEQIFFVPHPIDTSFYVPPNEFNHRESDLCLFVGAHLRDLNSLRLIIEDARIIAPHIRFAIVLHRDQVDKFNEVNGNYELFSQINENELLKLYQSASILVLPLIDSTGNNTILEAMACGLPMIVSDIGSVRDYVNEKFAKLTPPYNSSIMLEMIMNLLISRQELEMMSINAREHAQNFKWDVVAKRMLDIYEEILLD